MDKAVRSLAGIALLKLVSPAALAELERRSIWRGFRTGETIVEMDDRSDDVLFLVDGAVHVVVYSADGQCVLFRELTAGETFGHFAAIDGTARSASVVGQTDGRLARLAAAPFRKLLLDEPHVALRLLEETIGLVRRLSERVVEFSTQSVGTRIRVELLRRALAGGLSGNRVELPVMTHADFAAMVSTHREAVTREFGDLSKAGIISRHGRRIVIEDVAALSRLVDEASGTLVD